MYEIFDLSTSRSSLIVYVSAMKTKPRRYANKYAKEEIKVRYKVPIQANISEGKNITSKQT